MEPSTSKREKKTINSIYMCPECSCNFEVVCQKYRNSSRVPLILLCNHTICENCIRKSIPVGHVICPVCQLVSVIPKDCSLHDVFLPHSHIIGNIILKKFQETTNPNFNFIDVDNLDLEDSLETIAKFKIKTCNEHNSRINLNCLSCDVNLCCECYVEKDHIKHPAETLYKMNDNDMKNIANLTNYAHNVLDQLRISRQKIMNLISKNDNSLAAEQTISDYFSILHAKLNIVENNLKKKVIDSKSDTNNFNIIKNKIDTSIKKVTNLLKAHSMLPNNEINIRILYDCLKNIQNFECILSPTNDENLLNPFKFIVLDDKFTNLEENFVLNYEKNTLSLLPLKIDEEILLNNNVNNDNNDNNDNNTNINNSNGIKDDFNDIQMLSNTSDNNLDSSDSQSVDSYKSIIGGQFEKVIITHMNDLNSFFIQLDKKYNNIEYINRKLWAEISNSLFLTTPKLGQRYAVFYETKKKSTWRRAKFIDIDNTSGKKLYDVLFIDYGNRSKVKIENMRMIKSKIMKIPPLAIECKLYNSENLKVDDSHLKLLKIIKECKLYMKKIKWSKSGVQEVDLYILNMYGEYELVINILNLNRNLPKSVNFLSNNKNFEQGQLEEIIISHIDDPYNIYFQLKRRSMNLKFMEWKLKEKYENSVILACTPIENCNYIINHSYRDYNWLRCHVKTINKDNQTAVVFLVDFGDTLTVPWSEFRILLVNFIKIECLAIHAKLADVQPINDDNQWSMESIDFLNNLLNKNNCIWKIFINRVAEPLEVRLIQISDMSKICINALMIEKQLALSTNSLCDKIEWLDDHEKSEDKYISQLKQNAEKIVLAEEDTDLNGVIVKQVEIIKYEHPGLIYIQFFEHQKKTENFYKELKAFYDDKDERQNKSSWVPNELCVVYKDDEKLYKRAIVIAQIDDQHYSVSLYDDYSDIIVLLNNMFIYDDYFKNQKVPKATFKCHLANIKPAGSSDGKWSGTSIDMIKEVFNSHKSIYVKKVPDIRKKNTIAVKMWYCVTFTGGALEPFSKKKISISKLLVESGLAFNDLPNNDLPNNDENDTTNETEINITDNSSNLSMDDNNSLNSFKTSSSTKHENSDSEDIAMDVEDSSELPKKWLDPVSICKDGFEAHLITVDLKGHIYVRNIQFQEILQDMLENYKKLFDKLQHTPHDNWSPGEMCTIKYKDGNYYRGIVLYVLKDDQLIVHMVDYGSDHEINKNDLYKKVMYPTLPILVNKVQLYDVVSKIGGDFTNEDLDILTQLAPDRAYVELKYNCNNIDDIPFAEIFYENGESLNNKFVELSKNAIRLKTFNKNKNLIPSSQKIKSDKELKTEHFNYIKLPNTTYERVEMCIVNVLTYNEIILNVLNITDTYNSINLKITNDIQKYANNQPNLTTIKLNQICVAQYSQKPVWCRAIIYNIDNLNYGFVLLFLVDYGIIDSIPVKNLKVIKPEWCDLPISNYIAHLNIKLVNDLFKNEVFERIQKLMGQSKSVHILDENPLIVDLYDNNSLLYYQDFLENGILKLIQ